MICTRSSIHSGINLFDMFSPTVNPERKNGNNPGMSSDKNELWRVIKTAEQHRVLTPHYNKITVTMHARSHPHSAFNSGLLTKLATINQLFKPFIVKLSFYVHVDSLSLSHKTFLCKIYPSTYPPPPPTHTHTSKHNRSRLIYVWIHSK